MGKDPTEATKAGFAAANPLLKELLNQSILSKVTLSQDIQDMITQAGIVPDVITLAKGEDPDSAGNCRHDGHLYYYDAGFPVGSSVSSDRNRMQNRPKGKGMLMAS